MIAILPLLDVHPVAAHRWMAGEMPLPREGLTLSDILEFRRQSAHYHSGKTREQARLALEVADLIETKYPNLTPNQLIDALWWAIDELLETRPGRSGIP